MTSTLLCCNSLPSISAPQTSISWPRSSRLGFRCSSSRFPQFESDKEKKESSFRVKECAFSLALAIGLVTGIPQLGWAAHASPGPVLPDLAVLISGPPIKDPGALLRYALPIDNKAIREVQKPLEDITDSLKISGVKALDSVERNLRQASRTLSQGKTMILQGIAEPKKAEGQELIGKLEVGMEELQRIVEERKRDAVAPKQKELLQYVGTIEEDMVDAFPYEVPEEYRNMPLLKGRATVDMKVKVKDNPNIQDCVFRIVLDGYNAPVTAGNFVDLVERHFYDGMEIQRADGFVVQTGDPQGPAEGFIDPSTEKVRTIPLEIMVVGDKTPVYGETLEDLGRYKAQTRLPFNAFGTMAMARDASDILGNQEVGEKSDANLIAHASIQLGCKISQLHRLEQICSNFLWNGKMHCVSWDKVTVPKKEGGLDLRNLTDLQNAMAIKRLWRFIKGDTMWAQWLGKRYVSQTASFWSLQLDNNASGLWKNIMKCRENGMKAVTKLIGNGEDTAFWLDSWLNHKTLVQLLGWNTTANRGKITDKVSNYITDGKWNLQGLLLPTYLKNLISETKIYDGRDKWIWSLTKNGEYSFKSCWDSVRVAKPNVEWHNIIWHAGNCRKHSLCAYKAIQGKLLTADRLLKWGVLQENECKLCHMLEESHEHLFFACSYSKIVWKRALDNLGIEATRDYNLLNEEFEPNSGSSQVFWLLKESELTPSNANILDGRYAVFGYVTENEDYLADLKVGDVIESIQVVSGVENLVNPSYKIAG